jgi:hypothetical protein
MQGQFVNVKGHSPHSKSIFNRVSYIFFQFLPPNGSVRNCIELQTNPPQPVIVNPSAFQSAQEDYAACGVDVEAALATLAATPISLHCWQGDDVGGFEKQGATLGGGGIQVTGSHPGKARNLAELRGDLDEAFRLIPGRHRVNLHAIYGDFGGKKIERNEIGPAHFAGWIDWAKSRGIGLDFNPTLFSHPLADRSLDGPRPRGRRGDKPLDSGRLQGPSR